MFNNLLMASFETSACAIIAGVIVILFFVNYFVCEKVEITFIEEEAFFWVNNLFLGLLLISLIFGLLIFYITIAVLSFLYLLFILISRWRNKCTRVNESTQKAQKLFEDKDKKGE